ncbi:Hachiman antiphage defense system protein HamA [Aquabacterium sp.]|uniref:Hachiman antiphage defense system protein HamA n=1 Tax=Aquabacterium sp. TaxID=1872578 RepID=UPI0024895351|nr:Hachiman antiphage defense system protein HamA [Aquabacterium sp.]MDI1259904.1 SAVED domain-containing protein [Aquabacterium sp.]
MTRFHEWCNDTETPIADHTLRLLAADPTKQPHAVKVVAKAVPSYYVSSDRAAQLLGRLGRTKLAKFVKEKLPTTKAIRSGDLGEVLCTAYIGEATSFTLGITKLRWKDHREMAMRGEDVLAFSLNARGKGLKVLKTEVKSRVAMGSGVIGDARKALSSNKGLPSAHALSFVADRLFEQGDKALRDAIDDVQLKSALKQSQVSHMLFTFSGNDPSKLLTTNLTNYKGAVPQMYVALSVKAHQDFIKSVFDAVKV